MNREFWLSVIVRAVKTAAQSAVAVIGTAQVAGLAGVSWADVGSVAGLAALLSVLTSVAAFNTPGLPEVDPVGVLADSKRYDVPAGEDVAFGEGSLPLDETAADDA